MKEPKIGEKIIECRRQQGITQDDLAQYMGVSKASVSKWETSTSYPDITLLPRIASYFSITVDELLGYEPQMSKRQIRSSIQQLSQNFLSEPFVTAKQKCVELTQKYYSCFPLLYQIGTTLLIYRNLALHIFVNCLLGKHPNPLERHLMVSATQSFRLLFLKQNMNFPDKLSGNINEF